MPLYCGIDLHAKTSYIEIGDEQRRRVFKRNVPNDKELILGFLEPYKSQLEGVVVESTFNWYWLVDALMEKDYAVHLANPCAIKQYLGLKYVDDKHDAFWLADLLSLGILKEGYIYPKEQRPVRDLLRKRGLLVRLRTSLLTSLQNTVVNSPSTDSSQFEEQAKAVKETYETLQKLLEEKGPIIFESRVPKDVQKGMRLVGSKQKNNKKGSSRSI